MVKKKKQPKALCPGRCEKERCFDKLTIFKMVYLVFNLIFLSGTIVLWILYKRYKDKEIYVLTLQRIITIIIIFIILDMSLGLINAFIGF